MDNEIFNKFFHADAEVTDAEVTKPNKNQQLIEFLKHRVAVSDSIVLVRYPAGIVRRILLINTFLRRVPYLLLRGKIDPSLLKDLKRDLREAASSSWITLARVYPFAYANNLSEWRFFNDTPEEKIRLIENNRDFCTVVLPVSDEIGMLATVVKHLCIVRRKLRTDMNIEVINVLKEVGEKLLTDLNSIIGRYCIRDLLAGRSCSQTHSEAQ